MAFAHASAAQLARFSRPACRCSRRRPRMAALDAPVKEDIRTRLNRLLTTTAAPPQTEAERVRHTTDPGKNYKVLIFNDDTNSKEYVTRVLLRCIPGLTEEHAWAIMQKAHSDGSAVVGIWIFEISEGYCDLLRNNGLRSDIQQV